MQNFSPHVPHGGYARTPGPQRPVWDEVAVRRHKNNIPTHPLHGGALGWHGALGSKIKPRSNRRSESDLSCNTTRRIYEYLCGTPSTRHRRVLVGPGRVSQPASPPIVRFLTFGGGIWVVLFLRYVLHRCVLSARAAAYGGSKKAGSQNPIRGCEDTDNSLMNRLPSRLVLVPQGFKESEWHRQGSDFSRSAPVSRHRCSDTVLATVERVLWRAGASTSSTRKAKARGTACQCSLLARSVYRRSTTAARQKQRKQRANCPLMPDLNRCLCGVASFTGLVGRFGFEKCLKLAKPNQCSGTGLPNYHIEGLVVWLRPASKDPVAGVWPLRIAASRVET